MKSVYRFALLLCLLGNFAAYAIPIYTDRDAWYAAFEGDAYEVDLTAGPAPLAEGSVLQSGSPIYLPPNFVWSMSFNRDLTAVEGTDWNNYVDPSAGAPLILSSRVNNLTGTFSHGVRKFGFEVLPTRSGLMTLSLSDGSTLSRYVTAGGAPQFFGWVDGPGWEEGITSFTISGGRNGMLIGNFVVPEPASTLCLLGVGVAGLSFLRRRIS